MSSSPSDESNEGNSMLSPDASPIMASSGPPSDSNIMTPHEPEATNPRSADAAVSDLDHVESDLPGTSLASTSQFILDPSNIKQLEAFMVFLELPADSDASFGNGPSRLNTDLTCSTTRDIAKCSLVIGH
ncbi:hypothetical protein WAI453_008425 [Rhynchosporium graminicola]